MRINAMKKKEKLGHLDSMAHSKKMHMNRSSTASTLSLDTPKLMEFEKADPTDVKLEITKRDDIKHLYMQQYLTNRIKELSLLMQNSISQGIRN
ncbi:hypothetical protein GH733_002826 [Mirounga leonina]|nr:hypothetical protein GH733_002826 [Mirounga leonina]